MQQQQAELQIEQAKVQQTLKALVKSQTELQAQMRTALEEKNYQQKR